MFILSFLRGVRGMCLLGGQGQVEPANLPWQSGAKGLDFASERDTCGLVRVRPA